VYIDDGNDNNNFSPYSAATATTFDTSSVPLTLTSGKYYRVKYTAKNVAGEGPFSPEVTILLGDEPGPI
jgi:hypothetical protein